ncbi:unnamed protein product [Meganyctiphanes norvegica]|uniref:Anaphase-promoting complex subunit 1 n=1 Tax=Meganyctiphanes norvegica TaxID=48144 RepID=A0AAV2RRG3_MEGNR
MISCGDAQEYVPFGREYMPHHPGEVGLPSPHCPSLNPISAYSNALHQLDNVPCDVPKDWWTIRESKDGLTEEELYSCGPTVVWSRGQGYSRQVIKCLTCDSPVQQVLFATFYTYPDQPALLGEPIPDEPTGETINSICIIESDCLSIFTEDGDDYSIALPFPVHKVWPCKYGILLERRVSASKESSPKAETDRLPTLYSLLHPLDEINPLLYKEGANNSLQASYVSDLSQEVVFTSHKPSIALLYNSQHRVHTLWKIRRAKQEENTIVLANSHSCTNSIILPNVSTTPSRLSSHHGSLSQTQSPYSFMSPGPLSRTPTTSRMWMSAFTSGAPGTPPNLLQTPKQHMATLSRNQSPSIFGGQHLRLGISPSPARSPCPLTPRSPFHSHSNFNETVLEPEPLVPDVCLDHLWTDNSSTRASKAFLTEDHVGQRYLCLLLSQSGMLRLIKYEYTNDNSGIILGTISSIPAKDATAITSLKMTLVVDGSNSLSLYSGVVHVCRVHLSGLPSFNTSLFKDFSSLNISSRIQSPATTPMRRSSLITSSRPSSALDAKFDVGLSPVASERGQLPDGSYIEDPSLPLSSAIHSLQDATEQRVTLEHATGNYYRVTLPEMSSSPLVKLSLTALKYILPRDVALQLLNKWYSTRNAPGAGDFSPNGEWMMFSMMLLAMMGYDTDKLALLICPMEASEGSCSPMVATKKFRAAESGSDNDWEYMLSSSLHVAAGNTLSEVLGLQRVGVLQREQQPNIATLNTSAPLYSSFPAILFTLHMVYEELKLNTLHWEQCSLMVTCLDQLAADLRADSYLHHYWRDFPTLCPLYGPPVQLSEDQLSKMTFPGYFTTQPPNVMAHLHNIMNMEDLSPFPYIPDVCKTTKNIILLYSVAAADCDITDIPVERFLRRISPSGKKQQPCSTNTSLTGLPIHPPFRSPNSPSIQEKIVLLTNQLGLTVRDIDLLAPGVSLLLMNAQHMCRMNPPQDWPPSAYHLIRRPDLVAHREEASQINNNSSKGIKVRNSRQLDTTPEVKKTSASGKEESDGMDSIDTDMLALRWPLDQRITEVRRMLISSQPVTINISQRAEVSDHDFLEEQERHLFALCIRTMALPLARGMFTLFTSSPVITETLPLPRLNLSGRAPPRGTAVDLSNIEVPPNMDMWPHFHNGVAAGLKITSNCGEIDSTWIVYNKPKGSTESPTEHAGFLMALGLNGHLSNLAIVNMHDYLARGHEMTCVGLLLGISTAKRGTMDLQTTKLLSVHLECLLPPTSTELDVPHTVQVAAIMGVGLVYQDTAHRHMAEVLLQEIGRPPGPEMENSNDRESYSLAAGLALGLVMFGRGGEAVGFTDLNIAGELYHYIEGGHKKPLFGVHKDKYKSPSYQIKEGERVNIDVTSPGATLALGMIYFRSHNKAIAEWMVAPNTPYLLDQVRPDFLVLRTIALGLIMWDDVMPNSKWVESHVPSTVLQHVHRGGNQSTPGIDYESMHQAYYNILAGACMVLGLKFAGSANSEAFQVLWKYTRMFTNFTKRSVAELAGKSTIETCLNIILLSLSMVMAGTGDLEVLRIIRYLRSRVGPANSSVGYGSHLAIHMALGFLFLGGGRFSLSTSNMAIAALLIACFPKFPTHSNDNRYHLQALRHLYVLAAEPRLLVPVDVDSGHLCRANVLVKFKDTDQYKCESYETMAPMMLPELSKLAEVIVEGDATNHHYWAVRFTENSKAWSVLESLLRSDEGIAVKLKDGRYPYGEAPSGFQVQLAHYLTSDKSARWTMNSSLLEEVSGCSSELVKAMVGGSLEKSQISSSSSLVKEDTFAQVLATIIYEYLSAGKPQTISNWLAALQGVKRVTVLNQRAGLLLWQVKLIARASHFLHRLCPQTETICSVTSQLFNDSPTAVQPMDEGDEQPKDHQIARPLVSPEQALSLHQRLIMLTDAWFEEVSEEIVSYLQGDKDRPYSAKCAFSLVMSDLPVPHNMPDVQSLAEDPISLIMELRKYGLSDKAIGAISKTLFCMPG